MPNTSEIRFFLVSAALLFLLLSGFIIFFIILYYRKQIVNIRQKQKLKSEFSQTLLESQLEIQEQTFKNISQEIHDNIGQALTLAKLNLNTMPPSADETAQEKIGMTKELVSKAIVDLRDLSRSLNTDHIAAMGLQKAIEYELNLISRSSGIQTSMNATGQSFRPDKQKELILFRIIQEVLSNVIKHAGATSIHASLHYQSDQLELSVADNGKGFFLEEIQQRNLQNTGLGLRNMQNRATLIGASFTMESEPGKGTTITIRLPRDHKDNSDHSGS